MSKLVSFSSLLLMVSIALSCAADDQQKAEKMLNKVSAMATDPGGKRAVSEAVSFTTSAPREELAMRRHAMDLNYGELVLAYELTKTGANMEEIALQLKSGKTIWQIAQDQRVNWKELTSAGKKVNGRIDSNLLKRFANDKKDAERELADGYDPFVDSVPADKKISPQDIADAQERYTFLHDHAGVVVGSSLDLVHEKAVQSVRPDPIRNGGPQDVGQNTRPGPH